MKQIFTTAFSAIALFSCNTATTTTKAGDSASAPAIAATEKIDYPYTIEHPDNWTPGNRQNTLVALKGLKAFENGDVAASVASFGDSVKVELDQYEATLSNDSLKAMFTKWRNDMKDLKIVMNDWESVVSEDKKTEYVSLWYKQIWTDAKGKTDSVECMDDMRMKDGKIVLLNEKTRRFPAKK